MYAPHLTQAYTPKHTCLHHLHPLLGVEFVGAQHPPHSVVQHLCSSAGQAAQARSLQAGQVVVQGQAQRGSTLQQQTRTQVCTQAELRVHMHTWMLIQTAAGVALPSFGQQPIVNMCPAAQSVTLCKLSDTPAAAMSGVASHA